MSDITETELDRLLSEIHRGMRQGPWVEHLRLAVNELLAKRVKAETKPMHEPVSEDELEAMMNQIHYGTAGSWFNNVRAAGNALLARRAAATRAEVVVTEAMIDECEKAFYDSNEVRNGDQIDFGIRWLADRLNNKHVTLVDPRVDIVRAFMLGGARHSDNIDKEIEIFLERLDEVKP